jgi:hypothetical protein
VQHAVGLDEAYVDAGRVEQRDERLAGRAQVVVLAVTSSVGGSPSMLRSRVGTAGGGSSVGSRNARTRVSFSGSPIASWREEMPSRSGNRDATASWIDIVHPAAGTGNMDSLEPVIQPTTWSRSQFAAGTSATLRPRLRMTIRSATS